MSIIRITSHRLYVGHQRVHHGPPAIVAGTMLLIWGLLDWRDASVWFQRGEQL